MEKSKSFSESVGDGIIQRLEVDFEKQTTCLTLHRWTGPDGGSLETISVLFSAVVLQNFEDMFESSVVLDIEEYFDQQLFWQYSDDFIGRKKNYLSGEVLNLIAQDASCRFFILSASFGMEGFIICRDFQIITTS